MSINLKSHIRGVPDFPKQGILFYDIATLMAHGPAWQETVARMSEIVKKEKPEMIFAIESRGFLIASPVAAQLGIGLGMIRKKGKLPGKTAQISYDLEYGSDVLEIQEGLFRPGTKALVVDDLLATGGTTKAAISLARQIGIEVTGAACVIELSFLNGRSKLDVPVHSLLQYDE
jgi:adenine phosphoribosyltransferase